MADQSSFFDELARNMLLISRTPQKLRITRVRGAEHDQLSYHGWIYNEMGEDGHALKGSILEPFPLTPVND